MQSALQRISSRRTMITFNNFRRHGSPNIVDITLPNKSVIYLAGENIPHDILFSKGESGEILYNDIPIHHAKSSFLKKVFFCIDIGKMFSHDLTIIQNLQIYADIFASSCIQNAPLKYFEIPSNIWNTNVKNIDKQTVKILECGLMFYFQGKICMLHNIDDNTAHNEKVKHLVSTRVSSGNDMIIHTGCAIKIESCIQISI